MTGFKNRKELINSRPPTEDKMPEGPKQCAVIVRLVSEMAATPLLHLQWENVVWKAIVSAGSSRVMDPRVKGFFQSYSQKDPAFLKDLGPIDYDFQVLVRSGLTGKLAGDLCDGVKEQIMETFDVPEGTDPVEFHCSVCGIVNEKFTLLPLRKG